MKKKTIILRSYRTRIIAFFSIIIILIVVSAASRNYILFKKNSTENMFSEMQQDQQKKAYQLKTLINRNSEIINNLSIIIGNYSDIIKDNRRTFYENTLHRVIEDNFQIYSIWTVFKPFTIDDSDDFYSKPYEAITGQFAINYNRQNEYLSIKDISPDDYKLLDKYIPMFTTGKNVIIVGPIKNPYWQLAGKSYIVRIVSPIVADNQIVGIVGIDINLETISSIINKSKFNVYFLDDNLKTIYSNDDNSIIGRNILETYPYLSTNSSFTKNIAIHQNNTDISYLFNPNDEIFYSTIPIYFDNAKSYWNIFFYSKAEDVIITNKKDRLRFIITPIFVFILLMSFIILIINSLISFFTETNQYIQDLTKNNKFSHFKNKRKNIEMREIQNSLFDISKLLKEYESSTNDILSNNFKYNKGTDNIILENLDKIKDKLQEDIEKQEEQNTQQEIVNIVSNAVADINNIQREYINNIEQLSFESIKYISNFVEGVQGGFYIKESPDNENPYLNLIAFYSYNRRIYNNKKIEIGDGLAGTCAQEQKVIYSKVPNNYLEISSGLGKTPPNYIYLQPLIVHEKIYGIIEVAFLEKIKKHHIQFLDAISEILAATISTAEINTKTKILLEQTQNISAEMHQKEEQLNRQISELETVKIKSEMVELDRITVLNSLDQLTFFAEFDVNGRVLSINENLSEKLQIASIDAQTLSYFDIFFISDTETHNKYWEDLLNGKTVEFELNISLGKLSYWFNCIMNPVYNAKEKIYKIIFFAIDYTEIKNREVEMKKLLVEVNEKSEQISVQEQEMDDFFLDFQNITDDLKAAQEQNAKLEEEKEKAILSAEFIQKEFRKRATRTKRIEMNLKNKIKELQEKVDNSDNN